MSVNPELRDEWFRYADEDRQMAELALNENGPPNQICFHAQQMAEKYLKGFLVEHNKEFEKTHQLPYLLQLCEELKASFQTLEEDIFLLNRFYIEPRYPGDIPEFSLGDAQDALAAAMRVKDFINRTTSEDSAQ